MVLEGSLDATFSIKALLDHVAKALEFLLSAERVAKAAGKTKATAKHAPGALFQKTLRKAAPSMAEVITEILQDPGFAALSEENRKKIEVVFATLDQARTEKADAQEPTDDSTAAS